MPNPIFRAGFAAAAMLACAPAFAQSSDAPPAPETQRNGTFAIVGVGAAAIPEYEGSDRYSIAPAPAALGSIGGYNFQLVGNRLSVDVIADGTGPGPGWDIQAGPLAVVNFNRTSTSGIGNAQVALLPERDVAVEVGGYFGIAKVGVFTSDYDRLSLSASYRHDVSNVHDSGIFSPSVSYMTPLSRKALVGIFANAERVENGFADTYFSITPADSAASGLPVYNAEGGWKHWGVGAGGAVALTGDLTGGLLAVGGVNYRRLLGDFGDSPITQVGSRDQWMGLVGLAYSF